MREMTKLLLVLVALFAFVGTSFAQGTTPAPAKPAAPAKPTAPAKPAEKKEVKDSVVKGRRGRGEIVSLDAKAGTVKVKGRDREATLIADTKETKGALAKVKVGDPVRFTFSEKDGKFVLRSLEKSRPRTESRSSREKTQKPESTAPTK